MKFVFELTLEEQDKICNEHYLNWNGCCGTCPLRIDGNICVRDLCDDKTSLRETVTKEKWETKEKVEKGNKLMGFAKNETLAQINEKARMHNMSYGQYVLARENGQFREDYGTKVKLAYSPRQAFCKVRRFVK